jgi:tRNA pseudouridine55 synthase
VKLAARPVRIDAIRVLAYEWPFLDVEIDCGKGTYIRSIARDLGMKLGCGGMVETLRRTQIGPFAAVGGIGLDATPDEARAKLQPMAAAVAGMVTVQIGGDCHRRFRSGQAVNYVTSDGQLPADASEIAVLNEMGELAGIGLYARGAIKPRIVFSGSSGEH